jgi:hypothetical protein
MLRISQWYNNYTTSIHSRKVLAAAAMLKQRVYLYCVWFGTTIYSKQKYKGPWTAAKKDFS